MEELIDGDVQKLNSNGHRKMEAVLKMPTFIVEQISKCKTWAEELMIMLMISARVRWLELILDNDGDGEDDNLKMSIMTMIMIIVIIMMPMVKMTSWRFWSWCHIRCWAALVRWTQWVRCQLCCSPSILTGSYMRTMLIFEQYKVLKSGKLCFLILFPDLSWSECPHAADQWLSGHSGWQTMKTNIGKAIFGSVLMSICRTQDFMTGVPAIPGKHLSIELVSKMVRFFCLQFVIYTMSIFTIFFRWARLELFQAYPGCSMTWPANHLEQLAGNKFTDQGDWWMFNMAHNLHCRPLARTK